MSAARDPYAIAIRLVNLDTPLEPLSDVADYAQVRVFVMWQDRILGSLDIANSYQSTTVEALCEAIIERFSVRLSRMVLAAQIMGLEARGIPPPPRPSVSVSVVIATYDRPDELRECLRGLLMQPGPDSLEIVVVDNHPASRLTPPVVAEFPRVVLVSEERRGLAYARNKGFLAASGEIVLATDDDVRIGNNWLEKMVAPFSQPDVMIVTGNVLPAELETSAQRVFEAYGALRGGYDGRSVNGAWFQAFRTAVPTWELGATANAAFRASIFKHPDIGLMDEALGPGMPSGSGEDTYLFYKVLKAGFTLVYEPSAYVWHRHRRDLPALRGQIYNYSKGHVAYLLTTMLRDRDLRALVHLGIRLPQSYLMRIKERLLGKSDYPLSFIGLEIAGTLMGPWALWQSRRRVQREGRSSKSLSSVEDVKSSQHPPYVNTPIGKHVSCRDSVDQ